MNSLPQVTFWHEPGAQLTASVGEVIWGVITSSCWGWSGEPLATTSTARRETRVVKIIVIDEGKKVLGGWSRERCREIQKTG
jgi:hypothetical protein